MHSFHVWAPFPKNVEVEVAGKRFPLTRGAGACWSGDIAAANPGDDYGFVLNGEGPIPDPRSPSQPNGVNGLSRLVDGHFDWNDQGFQAPPLAAALIYELHLGTFTPAGTFVSAIEKLEHLVSLGVTHVELMPVAEFSGNHGWGYDGVDLFAPHHAYGPPGDLKKLVAACHARGLAVILDVVYNHLGPAGNYLGKYAPYFTKKFATAWGEGVNFDGPDSGHVRRFFCDNALMWLRDFHFDGLRLDAVHGILDTSAIHILEQLKTEVESLSAQTGRHLVLIPESDLNDPRLLWSRERGGYQLDAQWSDDFHHALHTVLTGETTGYYSDFGKLEHLAKALRHAFVYNGSFSPHRRRVHGRPAGDLPGYRFLAYLQNHDQVGNRAIGDRTSQLMSPGKLKIGAAFVLLSPFVPLLFQGEEWGASTPFCYFTDHPDPALAKAVRDGRCQEFAAFGWKPEAVADPQAPETFQHSKLNWNEIPQPFHSEILEWHKQLIRLRRSEPSLPAAGLHAFEVRFDEAQRWFFFQRGSVALVCNLAPVAQTVPLPCGNHQVLLASPNNLVRGPDHVELPPDAIVILKLAS